MNLAHAVTCIFTQGFESCNAENMSRGLVRTRGRKPHVKHILYLTSEPAAYSQEHKACFFNSK
jgi:hypothetical protein